MHLASSWKTVLVAIWIALVLLAWRGVGWDSWGNIISTSNPQSHITSDKAVDMDRYSTQNKTVAKWIGTY